MLLIEDVNNWYDLMNYLCKNISPLEFHLDSKSNLAYPLIRNGGSLLCRY